jgi:hypothetical protein
MASLSAYYPLPVVAGTTAGTYAEGDDSRIVGALPAATAGTGSVLAHSGSAGATARTLSSRFSEVVRVADFGAVGDGVTDDTAAIQNAINRAIALGGAVIEFEPKTYNLTSTFNNNVANTMNPDTGYITRHHLRITGGTSSLRLLINGNGAKLYTNSSTAYSNIGQIIYLASEFDIIEFDSITIERGPEKITENPVWTLYEIGFGAFAVSSNISNKLGFYNVRFINNTQFINGSWFYGDNSSKKLRQLIFDNCQWLYPYGSNRTGLGIDQSAGVCMLMDQWINEALFSGCYIDMASNGFIPNDVNYLRDGFNQGNGVSTRWENCTVKNCSIEGIFAYGPRFALGAFTNTINWPDVGQNIVLNVGNNPVNNNFTPKIGSRFILHPFSNSNTGNGIWAGAGIFEWISNTSPFGIGASITLKRLSDDLMPIVKYYQNGNPSVGSSVNLLSSNYVLTDHALANLHQVHFNNCRFEGNNVVRQNGTYKLRDITVDVGGTGYTEAPSVVITPNDGVTATATISNGQITSVTITNSNYFNNASIGYFSSPPVISFSGGNGSGALATANLMNNRPSPAIWSSISTTVTNCCFVNCDSSLALKNGTARVGPTIVSNNVFIYENMGINNGAIGELWHDYLKFENNTIVSEKPLRPTSIGGRFASIKNNFFHSYLKPEKRRASYPLVIQNSIKPCNIEITDNRSLNYDHFIFSQNDNSYLFGSHEGIDCLKPTYGAATGWKQLKVDFRPARNGWVRLNTLDSLVYLNRGISAIYNIGSLMFFVATKNEDSEVNISVLQTDRNLPITKIRILKEGLINCVDVYVNDYTFFDTNTAIQCSVVSGDGRGPLTNPTSYSAITSIVADGTDALVTSNNHGLRSGEYVFISDSNSTPSINGNRQIIATTQNTFKIAGITITSSGNTGQFISSLRSPIKPINITSISQKNSDVTITHDAWSFVGEDPANGQSVYITGTNSNPSLDGQRIVSNTGSGRFDVTGITLTQSGTAAGTFIRLQDYATVLSVATELSLDKANDLHVNKTLGVGVSSVISGSSAPSLSAPNGSIYMRTDGDASTTLYVRANGAWEPIAAY